MSDQQTPDEGRLRAIFRALSDFEVDYAVFGAVAPGLQRVGPGDGRSRLFMRPEATNVERLKAALRKVFEDPNIDDISAEDLCGDYPAVRYMPPDGFGLDILTRLGDAFSYEDLDIEERDYDGVPVKVVTARTLWRLKKDTSRPMDRIDAGVLAERFGFREE